MDTVKIVDRSSLISALNRYFKIDPSNTAIVSVDMHRGHLDPSVATMPAPPEECKRVIGHAKDLFDFSRSKKIPVIHVIFVQRKIPGIGSENMNNRYWRTMQEVVNADDRLAAGRKSSIQDHNVEGAPGTQVIPELFREGDYVINNKKRLDCFYGTDLEILLHILKIETVVITGINTNTCVLNTAFTAFNRDYQVVVISDCVASMYGEDLHVLGLENIKRALGYVLTVDEFKKKVT